jgi:hypothetical protein
MKSAQHTDAHYRVPRKKRARHTKRDLNVGNEMKTEVTTTLIIAALLVVLYSLFHVGFQSGPQTVPKEVHQTRADISALSRAVDASKARTGVLPAETEGLAALATDGTRLPLVDPWGIAYHYTVSNGDYTIRCASFDKTFGTDDDMTSF